MVSSSGGSRGASHVTVIRGLKETPQALALRALKALSKSTVSTLQLSAIPSEILYGESVDLHRWTVLLNDESLLELSKQKESTKKYYLNSSAETIQEMFRTFMYPTSFAKGLLQLNISNAKDITDYGLTLIAHANPDLMSLNISGCSKITDIAIREISLHCPKLQELDISSCQCIEGHGLASLSDGCVFLTKINLSRCHSIKNWSLQKLFRGCKRLEEVHISYNKEVTDEEIRIMAENCPDILSFEAIECFYLSDQCVLALSQHCRDLDYLDLSRTEMTYRVSDVALMALGQKSFSLRTLKLSHCDQISDVGLGWLVEGCKVVELLDLNGCNKITDAGLRVLGTHCHALTSLDVSHAKSISDVGIASLSKGCPALKTLKVHGAFLFTDPSLAANQGTGKNLQPWEEVIGIASIAQRCSQLENLDLSGCFRLNRALGQFVSKLGGMKSLNLRGCNQCTSPNFIHLANGLPLLEVLILSDCGKAVNSKVLQAFSDKCKHLKTLHVCRCDEVKESAVRAISLMTQLESLDVSGCTNLTDSMMVHITQIERVPKLFHLDVTHCPKVGDSFLAWMSLKPHQLLYLYMRGSGVTKKAIMSTRDRFPNCEMLINDNFYGFWPKHRIKDRLLLNSYYQMIQGITKIQARLRKHRAIIRVKNINEERRRIAAQLLLQRIARGFLGRKSVKQMRHQRGVFRYAAIRITYLFKIAVARKKATRKRQERQRRLLIQASIRIQVCWRCYRDRRLLARLYLKKQHKNNVRVKATIKIQSVFRMALAKRRVERIKAMKKNSLRVRERKALIIQRNYRGYSSRERTKKMKAGQEEMKRKQLRSAITIQYRFRLYRTNKIVQEKQAMKRYRLQCCIKIQALMRGALARLHVMEMHMEEWALQKKKACLRIQCRWRVFKARCEFFGRIKERREWRIKLEQSASTIVRQARMKLAYLIRMKKHVEYIERLTIRANIEIKAATKIQAMIRAHQGRKIYYDKLKRKKGMWKELFDEEKGKRFFYNQLTGEVRWKIPKDLLDLIPHPPCDNCYKMDAALECGVCNELFCGTCFQEVHRGGRRMGHDYRALYDFYGKRIDYGDGEFPCQWPSEVIQDEVQGWMLRITPFRKPIDSFKCGWDKYEDIDPGKRTLKNQDEWRMKDSMGKDAPKEFYFNRNTFQTSYSIPEEVAQELSARTAPKVFDFGLFDGTTKTYQSLPGSAVPRTAGSQSLELYQGNSYSYDADYAQSYDPSQWYQGYYDADGNWIDYNYYDAGGEDPNMGVVPVSTDNAFTAVIDGQYESYADSQSYEYYNNSDK